MSNPAHKYAPFDPNHPDGSDDDSAGSIVMRTSANKAALKDMERAVFAGKKAIWPLFFATLVVGVGTSVWGLLKEKGDLRNVFIIVLIGWGVLAGIEGFMLNELSTVRRSHHPIIVLRLCFIFGGWFTGYLISSCVLIGVWKYQDRFAGSHTLAWALLIIQGLLCAAVIVAFVLYVQLYSRKIKKLQLRATLVTPGKTEQIASAVGSMRRKVSRLSRRSTKSSAPSSRRAKDGAVPSRRSSRASTLVGSGSVRSKASKRSATQVPTDSGTDTDDGYSDGARGKAGTGAGSGRSGGEDGYSSGAGSTTASDDDTLLGAHDQYSHGAQVRAPASTVSRSASTASTSSSFESRARDYPTTSSGAAIPDALRIGSPTSSPSSSRPTSPVYRTASTSSSSIRPGTIPVVVHGPSSTTRLAPTAARSTNPYFARAPPSTSPYPSQRPPALPPPSAYSPYTAYSPPSSPAPPDRASSPPYARPSAQSRQPGFGTRPPPPLASSAPPPAASRYAPPPSYPVGRSASTATARSAYPLSSGGQGGARALAVTNPDALPDMPLYHRPT
ncbi:hypothetical protein JCM9279_005704 [Rhodotorula babjevae]